MKAKVLNPTVVKLGLVSFFADISSEMLYPITPIFLSSMLGASMVSIGFIEGFAEALAGLLKTYAGAWSDRLAKRTPFVAFGYFLAALAKPMIGFSSSWTQVLLARGLDRTGKGLRTAPRDALLAEAVPENLRGAAFGWHRGMDTMGAALGPLLAIWYLSQSSNLRNIYYWAAIPGLIAVGISLLVREHHATPRVKPTSFALSNLPRNFKLYLSTWALFSLTNSSDVFLLLKAKREGLNLNEVILLYCGYNLVYALLSPYLGGLSDRMGRKKILLAGFLVFTLVYLGFSVATSHWHFWALFGVYGLYMAATDGVGKAFALDLIDPSLKATGLGAMGTVTGLSTIVASTVAGALWDAMGPSATFLYGALGGVLGFAALLFLDLKQDCAADSVGKTR